MSSDQGKESFPGGETGVSRGGSLRRRDEMEAQEAQEEGGREAQEEGGRLRSRQGLRMTGSMRA